MLDRQPRSGLATVKRDFSQNDPPGASPASVPTAAATKRSAISDSLRKAIQDGIASREAEKTSPTLSFLTGPYKRSLPHVDAPPSKKRQLPSSWSVSEPSSATFSYVSSQSSEYFGTHSSRGSVLPLDTQSRQEEPESSSFHPKFAQRAVEISLSDEQKRVLELVMEKKNVFLHRKCRNGQVCSSTGNYQIIP
ncbi:hypothetical protein F5148DRAFT_169369 [Russula earlei]|uniref:Uncharacterized protein n=1 Tax=Russula earlei TaxID=71964 RepID=A0ACC0U6Z3_9AGAM|nr:hypothetical protein F5148DRAFT_169369 [Russula earlei]